MLIVLQNSGEEYRCMWLLIESFVHYFVKKHSGSRFPQEKKYYITPGSIGSSVVKSKRVGATVGARYSEGNCSFSKIVGSKRKINPALTY